MSWFGNLFRTNIASRQKNGSDWFYNRDGGRARYSTMATNRAKLEAVLSNPAALTVFKLQCDLFSLGKISIKDNPEGNAPILDKLKNPNPFQGGRQFLWDYLFNIMLGYTFLEAGSKVITDANNLYWLSSANVEFPEELRNKLDRQYQSRESVDELLENTLDYTNYDNTIRKIKLKTLGAFADLTNGLYNWYGGPSVLDALYKVITNSELALDAKNINLDFSGKFVVSGMVKDDDIYQQNLSGTEQKSIEDAVGGEKQITAVKTPISISRYVEDMGKLELDKQYLTSYYKIGKIFGIPRDVLEANLEKGSTFDNQANARAAHVEYTLNPKGQDLMDGLKKYFSLEIDLVMTWDHLNFSQETQQAKMKNSLAMAEAISTLRLSGVSDQSINELLEIDIVFETASIEAPEIVEDVI